MDYNEKKEFIKRAIDANSFHSGQAEASAVNPNIWDEQLRDFEEKFLVVTPLAEQYDFRTPGVDYKITVDDRPAAAAALTETVDITVTAFSTRYVTFTPVEYGAGFQLTRAEAVRAFFDVAGRMTRKLGYMLAEKKDALAVAALAGGTSTVIVNSKSNITDLASSDTLNFAAITKAVQTMEDLYYRPDTLIINPKMKKHLMDNTQITDVSKFGSREAVANGLIGELFGLKIYVSSSVVPASNVSKAIVLGKSASGEKAFGYAIKRDPMIERQYFARGRFWDIVAHEEYNFQLLHPDAVCLIAAYT